MVENVTNWQIIYLLLLFSCSVVSNSLRPCGLQHSRLPYPSSSLGACSNSASLCIYLCIPTNLSNLALHPPKCGRDGQLSTRIFFFLFQVIESLQGCQCTNTGSISHDYLYISTWGHVFSSYQYSVHGICVLLSTQT